MASEEHLNSNGKTITEDNDKYVYIRIPYYTARKSNIRRMLASRGTSETYKVTKEDFLNQPLIKKEFGKHTPKTEIDL